MLGTIKAGLVAAKAFAIANAPLGLFVGGLVVGVAAIVTVAKAATESHKDMEEHVENLEQIADEMKDETLSEEDKETVREDKKKEVKATVATFFRHYWKALILITISGGLLIGGFLWQSKRFAVAAATATAQAALIKTMETNIQKTYGDKAVIAMQDPNWDPSMLAKETADGTAKALEGYNDPYRNYKVDNSDLSRSLYLINKYTMRPDVFRVKSNGLSRDMDAFEMANTLFRYQAEFNEMLRESHDFISENALMSKMGYFLAPRTSEEEIRLLTYGWRPGEIIDFGIGDIIAELGKHCDDPYYLESLNEKYKDGIPIKLNSTYSAKTFLAPSVIR